MYPRNGKRRDVPLIFIKKCDGELCLDGPEHFYCSSRSMTAIYPRVVISPLYLSRIVTAIYARIVRKPLY